MNVAQDWVDNVFTYGSKGLATVDQNLKQTLENVPAVFIPSSSDGSIAPIDQLLNDLKMVSRAVNPKPALQSALNHSKRILTNVLGPSPDTNLGPGAAHRDPLPVYYDAEIINFIR
jgi:hypothetical protein